jgi:protease-4
MQSYYDMFIGRVAAGRHIPEARVREIAQGRVYTGEAALALGLVDGIGGLGDAVHEAALEAGLAPDEEWTVLIPKRRLTLIELASRLTSAETTLPGAWQDMLRRAQAWDERPLAHMPFELEVTP